MENKEHWLSLNLFYSDMKSKPLCDSITTYVEWVLKSGIVSNFFYVRSKKNGPHLRLRFKTREDSIKILSDNLEEYFTTFLTNHPSRRSEPIFKNGLKLENKWKPNNSLEFDTYTTEITRFGGDIGLALSERQFQISSLSILKFYNQFGDVGMLNDEDIMTQAFKFNFVFAISMGMELRTVGLFFKQIYAQWLRYAYNSNDTNIVPFYEKQFIAQKNALKPTMLSLLDSIENQDIIQEELLGEWYSKNKSIGYSFLNQSEYLAQRAPKYSVAFGRDVEQKNYTLWAIWMDLIHLNNNRIGIVNQEESFLAFLLYRTVEDVLGHKLSMASSTY